MSVELMKLREALETARESLAEARVNYAAQDDCGDELQDVGTALKEASLLLGAASNGHTQVVAPIDAPQEFGQMVSGALKSATSIAVDGIRSDLMKVHAKVVEVLDSSKDLRERIREAIEPVDSVKELPQLLHEI